MKFALHRILHGELELDLIGKKYATDKSTGYFRGNSTKHIPSRFGLGYTLIYQKYFDKFKKKDIRLLEIGVLGGASLKMWQEYFRDGLIFGLDLDESCKQYEGVRTKIFIGNQIDNVFLQKVCSDVPEKFDIIIDDGSHFAKHIIESFNFLFDHIKPGGYYVIEDLRCARHKYWGSKIHNKGMQMFIEKEGNAHVSIDAFLTKLKGRKDIQRIDEYKNICFIEKSL
jgi:hypothetical protein